MGGCGRRNMVGSGCGLMIDWPMRLVSIAATLITHYVTVSLRDRVSTYMTIAVKTNVV